MNYEKLYFAFIERYKNQVIEEGVYTEKHHIIPRHAGGDDSKENLVKLTFRQHVFIHRLLWKAYKNHNDLIAWQMMSGAEVDKKLAAQKAIGRVNVVSGRLDEIRHLANTPEQRKKVSELGKQNVESGHLDQIRKIATEKWTGSNHTEEWKENKSIQMKEWVKNPDNYQKLLDGNKRRGELATEKAEQFSKDLTINAERNEEFLQEISSRSKNKFISPEGLEFDSPIFAAKYYCSDIEPYIIENWCKRNKYGWSRKPKAAEV